ncbi:hypothetical protein L6V77_00660 [Myxococcota bacterium]|nr:hypothetical protein [Myxococcota bacterium]
MRTAKLFGSALCLSSLTLGGCLIPEERGTARFVGEVTADAQPAVDAGPSETDLARVSDATQPTPDARVEPGADAGPCGPPPFDPAVAQVCPGSPGCAGAGGATLRVGAARQEVTDLGFELPRVEFLEEFGGCNESQGGGPGRCGALDRTFMRNCGRDRLCPEDEGYPGRADEGEGDIGADGVPIWDYFHDCGIDRLCPGDPGYPGAPDEGEGNGKFDGLWLAGFQNNRPALGVRDPLWARTIAVEDGETVVTLTSIDAVGIFYDDVKRIRTRAAEILAEERPDLEVDYMFVSSTHDHEAPDTMGQWAGEVDPEIDIPLVTGVNPRYISHLREKAARSIVDAVTSLQPATMRVAETHTGADGFLRDSRDPQVLNDTMGVVQFLDATEQTIATLVTWGNHPEGMSDVNNFITSDFAHGLRDGLENGIPESASTVARPGLGGVAVYMQGTVGGLMTPLGVEVRDLLGQVVTNYTFHRVDVMGWRLAGHALDALDAAVTPSEVPVRFAHSNFVIPVDNRIFHVATLVNLFNRENPYFDANLPIDACNMPHARTEMAVIQLGPVTLYSVPGELFPELAVGFDARWAHGRPQVRADNPNPPDLSAAPPPPYFSDLAPGQFRWPLGLGNDELGYLVPEYDYKLDDDAPYFTEPDGDHYEETNSVGPNAVPRVRIVLDRLIEALAP